MPILKVQDFNKLIFSGKISPVYLFMGEESYLADMCLKETKKFLNVSDLNREIFYSLESPAEDILNSLHTLPFLGGRRMIVVKDVNKMKAVDAEKLGVYLSNTVETSCLVLLYSANLKREMFAKRKGFINKCITSKNCVCVDCRKQYENEIREFIKNEFERRGKVVSDDVILRVLDASNPDLLDISNEIEKLSLFVGKDKKDISRDDLEKVSGYAKETNIYALVSYLEEKDLKKSMFVLERLLSEGEEPLAVLSAISSSVRKMLNAKSAIEEQEISTDKVAFKLRIPNFYARFFFSNLKKHSVEALKKGMKVILKADIAIKTGSSDAVSALEKIVLFICGAD
jgi:DNA polymerase-3 subunit delta